LYSLNKGLYFNVNLILVLVSVILTIVVLNFHFRGPKKKRVPSWMRKYIIGYLGKVFCFSYESRAFYIAAKYSTESKGSLTVLDEQPRGSIHKLESKSVSTNQRANSQIEIRKPINRGESRENRILLELTNENDEPCEQTNLVRMQQTKRPNDINAKKNKLKLNSQNEDKNMFSEEIFRNMEKFLIKIQKSLDPFKLQDETLKFSILKEILECQRLLLTANVSKKKHMDLSINEIYDEWKILAMVVDRLCFFVYLLALIISSTLFFMQEQIYLDD